MNPLTIRALAVAICTAIAFCAGWSVNGWRLGQRIEQIELDHAAAAEAASETARLKERAWNNQLEVARNEATKRETAIRANAAAARQSADGLRGDLDDLRRQLPELAADACRQRADTLAELFGACTERYSGLAEKADRYATDVQTLTEAWPK